MESPCSLNSHVGFWLAPCSWLTDSLTLWRTTGKMSFSGLIPFSWLKALIGNNILDFTRGWAHTEFMSDHATLRDAILYFASFEHCRDFMVQLRWPDGKITCPRCGGERLCWVEKQRLWKCYEGHKQPTFTLKTGTIFEDSPIALEKWLPATWLLLNCKNGISSYEIARDLGVTQKTAWFMLGRIRLAMQDEDTGGKLGGPGVEVEADETFIGGKARNMHPARRNKMRERGNFGKTIVSAVLERHGKVRATVVPNRRKKTIQAHLREHVEPGSTVYSDELLSYDGLDDYKHKVINHAETYVNGQIHTNGMENFWSLLKRGLKGTYVAVEPFHLFRYVDEQAFRFNNRDTDDVHRFVLGMKQIVGRRLTYKQLTGKAEVVQHG
jgi:transposase-like protein